jgi:2-amino-4-hydroxy-6-hydroxymethyldihydropteridine diphosphokinase
VVLSSGAVTAYLGLGSNLGDRAALIRSALVELEAAGVLVMARAPLYETDPVTTEPQPLYLNSAARVETTLAPDELLALCLTVERALGRDRPHGLTSPAPRPIDIDLLLYGATVMALPTLVVPHPRLLTRPFVRIPLADIAPPGLRHPVTNDPLDVAAPDPSVRLFP